MTVPAATLDLTGDGPECRASAADLLQLASGDDFARWPHPDQHDAGDLYPHGRASSPRRANPATGPARRHPELAPVATNLATDRPSVIFEPEVWACDLVRLAGFEPATRCLEDAAQLSDVVACLRK